MKVQLCLAVFLNVVIRHAFTAPTCSLENGPDNPEYYPHPTDCSKFLTCNWGALIEQQCPSGTYWNDAVKACDFPENVNCEPSSSSPPPTPTVAVASTAEECPNEYDPDHDVFLPHVDCTKFYICTQFGPVEKDCPSGLHWNQSANVCDWPQVAGCASGTDSPLTTTTEPAPSTTTSEAPKTNPAPAGKCPEEYDPNDEVFLPHADCTKYYLCTWNGRPVEQSCPPGLHWNANANRCDWPAQAGCRATHVAVKGSDLAAHVLDFEEFLISMRHRLD